MHSKISSEPLKIPSKTFLMGEYSVLLGGRALVFAHAPFFEITNSKPQSCFHPESPAGKLLNKKSKRQNFDFLDPHKGEGGFGGSTAEFIAAAKSLDANVETEQILSEYFENFENEKTPPSGADLCAQSFLKETFVEYSKSPLSYKAYDWPFDNLEILVFKTADKVKTHDHLDKLSLENLDELKEISELAVDAFVGGNEGAFLRALDVFTKEQAVQGLLAENTMRLIVAANKIDGVVTSRGCGAMGADVFTVFVKKGSKDYIRDQILDLSLNLSLEIDLGLKFVC